MLVVILRNFSQLGDLSESLVGWKRWVGLVGVEEVGGASWFGMESWMK